MSQAVTTYVCSCLLDGKSPIVTSNGRMFQIGHPMNYKSYDIVYLIQCQRYRQQYVGETAQLLSNQINSHRSDIRNRKYESKPVIGHFNCTFPVLCV